MGAPIWALSGVEIATTSLLVGAAVGVGTGDWRLARGQVVQCLKSLHEFSNHGSWRAAWPLSFMRDPLNRFHHGGDEAEMEVVLSWLKTQDDLKAKVIKGSKFEKEVSEEENDEGEKGDEADPKKKATKPKKK